MICYTLYVNANGLLVWKSCHDEIFQVVGFNKHGDFVLNTI